MCLNGMAIWPTNQLLLRVDTENNAGIHTIIHSSLGESSSSLGPQRTLAHSRSIGGSGHVSPNWPFI